MGCRKAILPLPGAFEPGRYSRQSSGRYRLDGAAAFHLVGRFRSDYGYLALYNSLYILPLLNNVFAALGLLALSLALAALIVHFDHRPKRS